MSASISADDDPNFNPITSPQPDDTVFAGQYFDIKWTNNTPYPVSLLLYYWGTERNWILADNIPNVGMYHWWVSDQIAYPTLVNTPYAGDPNWFEIHIYNGSFRQAMGPNADSYVGIADSVLKMNRGALWFNITAPIYSVQIYSVETVNPTSFSTISGGTTETIPITWSTVPSPTNTGISAPTHSGPISSGAGRPSQRLPTFASISGGMGGWEDIPLGKLLWMILGGILAGIAIV